MVYIIQMWCDGACKNNGGYNANKLVVAGAGLYYPRGKRDLQQLYRAIPVNINQGNQNATNNRAELEGLIMALETAEEVIDGLSNRPSVQVDINMDSKYVVEGMMQWRYKWEANGWQNVRGLPVANRDLFERAIELEERIENSRAQVFYLHVPRTENQKADELANMGCEEALAEFNSRSACHQQSYQLVDWSDEYDSDDMY